MNIILANVIVYLTRYAFFIRHLFRNYYIKTTIGALKWAVIAYAFSLVGGYYAVICYTALIVYELLKMLKLNKYILINTLLYVTSLSFIYFTKEYGVISLLPFGALFIKIILKPILKNKDNKYTDLIINLIICVYSYKYYLIVLFIYKVFEILFPAIGNTIKGITDYTNKKTN
jgi:hypothetical protein